jgi:serine phosphatase RsbU (regulator of sigma subunit)
VRLNEQAAVTSDQQAASGSSGWVTRIDSTAKWRPSGAATGALLIGLLVTAALALTSLALYNRNERRLLRLRARELGLVLSATVPTTQTPLATATELANATDGSRQKFEAFMAGYVGAGRQFTSVSLWPLGHPRLAPTVVLGARPLLTSMPAQARRLLEHPSHRGALELTGIMGTTRPTLGFAYSTTSRTPRFAVYAENRLPANRRSSIERNSAFADLNYVLYLGRSTRSSQLLVTNLSRLPIRGRQASDVVPFGASAFTLVVAAKGSLGGTFFRDLPWLIAIAGALLSLAAAFTADRMSHGRRRAEQLARDLDEVAAQNRDLYREQRGIAQTLQHALLPERLPELRGLELSALYVPASADVVVGGDWYDVVALGEQRAVLIVGDVAGHGLQAATTMALLRHAALAYAAQDARPASVLGKLALFAGARGIRGHFATVLCALIDRDAKRLTVASAGHLAPLLLEGDSGAFVALDIDAAIGIARNGASRYRETTLPLPPSGTLLAFTDGLVERRGEVIDVGLDRLRNAAIEQQLPLQELLRKLAHDLVSENHHDDTAIVGIQWRA